jgi:hypothetical protein
LFTAENTQLSPREHMLMENENEQTRLAREHAVTLKRLELELQRDKNNAAIELKKLEIKWANLLRIPLLILKLPIALPMSFSYVVYILKGIDPPKDFWAFLR